MSVVLFKITPEAFECSFTTYTIDSGIFLGPVTYINCLDTLKYDNLCYPQNVKKILGDWPIVYKTYFCPRTKIYKVYDPLYYIGEPKHLVTTSISNFSVEQEEKALSIRVPANKVLEAAEAGLDSVYRLSRFTTLYELLKHKLQYENRCARK